MPQRRFYSTVIVAALIFVWSLAAAGCGDSGTRATLDGFLTAAKNKDCEKMVDYIDLGSQEAQSGNIGRSDLIKACKDEGGLGNVVSYRVTGEKIEGDTVVMGVEITVNEGGQENTNSGSFNLVRKEGTWKLTAL